MAMNSLLFLSYLRKKFTMSHFKTVCRTLFYQYLLLIVGFSLGFYLNAEWVGFKSPILCRSFNNIFFPVRFNDDVLSKIKDWGAFKLWALRNYPNNFKIIEDAVSAEEWYVAKFSYTDHKGMERTEIDSIRIRWKPWEYYYEDNRPTDDELKDYIENGDLNSNETDRARSLIREKMEKSKFKA